MEIVLKTWINWQGKVIQGRKLFRVNKSGVRYGPYVKNSLSQCFCSSVLNHLRMFQPLPGGCSQQVEEEDTSLCERITMVHTCAVTQVRSQLHDMHQRRIVSLESLRLLCFFFFSYESYFLFDCLTVRLVPRRVRAWFALQPSRFCYLSLCGSHCIPCASADQRVSLHKKLDQQKSSLSRKNVFSAS